MTPQSYLHQRPDWPNLHWRAADLIDLLADVRRRQGRLLGRMGDLGLAMREKLSLEALTAEVVKTSEIEGELLDPELVRSSIARRLNIAGGGITPQARSVEGIVELTLDATRNYARKLTAERLFRWHSLLFPGGRNEFDETITVGNWRNDAKGPMVVAGSGRVGREIVHFQAPPASVLNTEMRSFLDWCNAPSETDAVLKAALTHLWFVTIHPFDDGNGRIARAIANMMLARANGTPDCFYSMSSQIMQERRDYYRVLETTQKGDTDVTRWMKWFLECLGRTIDSAQQRVTAALSAARFWEQAQKSGLAFNHRQRRLVNQLLNGFEGKLTADKWAKIAKCSPGVADQDIAELLHFGILARSSTNGKNISYHLADRRSPAP